jgi:penicillin-binding protein 1A
MGYTPQLLAGVWVGCDDPFLHIPKYGTSGGSAMAMPEWAYFMQKVYADKSLNIDPKAQFAIPSELNNNPIYADQNFNAIGHEGRGVDSADVQGNGDASDYGVPVDVPVESDFSKEAPKEKNTQTREPKAVMGPMNYNPDKKDSTKKEEKGKKTVTKNQKTGGDY